MSSEHLRLSNRRVAETFGVEANGLHYTAAVGRHADGRIGELFLANHKSNSQADTNARDCGIAFSFAVQHGADPCDSPSALSRPTRPRLRSARGRARYSA
jgi:hypothetical protein